MRQAVTTGIRTIEISSTEDPGAPGPGEALLAIGSVGLCGSDYEMWLGSDPYSRFPVRQGHEFSASIIALGDGPTDLHVGDVVAVEPLLPDRVCLACRRGHPNCCSSLRVIGSHVDGALTERLMVPIRNLFPVGDLGPDLAAFVEPVSIGLQMVTRGGVARGDQVVIFGAGPIGQAVQLVAADRGARVLCVDVVPSRLERALQAGAEVVVDAGAADVAAAIGRWTNGEGATVAFEATGVASVLRQALDCVAHSGTVVVAGTSNDETTIPTMLLVKKELNLLGSRNNAGLYAEAVALVQRYRDRCEQLITHRFPLEATQEAMEFGVANPHLVNKVMIQVAP